MTVEKTDREWIVDAIQKVVSGKPLNRYSFSTISEPNHCAQLVRETIEGGLGIRANEWEVGTLAHKYRAKRVGKDGDYRWAIDYEAAAKELGLAKPFSEVQAGDILYWPYSKWGHTALYVGLIDGEPHVLENAGWKPLDRQAQGARLPLGRNAYVFLSPLQLLGPPRLTITPTRAIQLAEQAPVTPIVTPTGSQARILPEGWEPLYDPATAKVIPGRFVSVRRRGNEVRIFDVPAYRVKEERLT